MKTDPNPAPANVARRRRWRGLVLLLVSLALLAALGGGITVAARSEAGTRWLLDQVPGLTVQGVRGSLWGDHLSVDTLHWQGNPQQPTLQVERLEIVQPSWRWLPHAGAWLSVSAPAVTATRVVFRTPREIDPAAPPPTQLRLPLALHVEALQLAQLQVDDQAPWLDVRAALHIGDAEGIAHRIAGLSMHNDKLQLHADARIGSDAPLPLALTLRATSTAATPWSANAQAEGPLAGFSLRATLRGDARDAKAPSLDASARIEPFADWPLAALQLSTRSLDLATLSSAAPHTRIDAEAQVQSVGLDRPAQATVRLLNHDPGHLDRGRLPVRQLLIELGGTPNRLDRIDIRQFEAVLADEQADAGRVSGRGQWAGSELALQLRLDDVQPARLHHSVGAMRAGGALSFKLSGLALPQAPAAAKPAPWLARIDGTLDGTLGGSGKPVRAQLALTLTADAFELTQLSAQAGEAKAQATLQAQRTRDGGQRGWHLAGEGRFSNFDPLPWWPGAAGSAWARGPHRANGQWQLDLQWPETLPEQLRSSRSAAITALRGQAQLDLTDSLLAGVPLAAHAALRGDGTMITLQGNASAAGNQAALDGHFAADAAKDRWQLNATMPTIAALLPVANLVPGLRWPQAGSVQAQARIEGRWPALGSSGTGQARAVRLDDALLGEGQASWRLGAGSDAAVELDLSLNALSQGSQRIDALHARVSGTRQAHHLSLRADSPVRPPAWADNLLGSTAGGTRLLLEGRGAWRSAPDGGGQWQAEDTTLHLGAREGNGNGTWIDARNLQGSVRIAGSGALAQAVLAPGRALLPGGAALRWSQAAWRAEGSHFDLSSELEPLAVAPMLARLQPDIGWGGDLKLAGRIEVHAAERFDADIVLARSGGDLRIADETGTVQSLGIGELQLAFSAHDGVWRFAQGAAGRQFGEMAGAQTARTTAQARWPAPGVPLEGVLQVRVANLGAWGVWVPPGWRLGGSLQVSAALGGRFGAPELRGDMRGADLSVRNVLQGVGLSEGELVASLEGEVARVQRLSFKGGEGLLQVTGAATLGETPSARLHISAEHFRLLGRIDRRIVTSGNADLLLNRDALTLDGRFTIDEGLIDFSRSDAPVLDEDVTVVRAASAPGTLRDMRTAAAPLPAPLRNAQVNLVLGLGDKLQVRGRGLDASLRGDLRLATPNARLAINGSVHTATGTYVAYAQKMVIERGELAFSGAADNPRLDIVAVRPNLDVRVGVAVVGPLLNPRVRLFSEPEMTEMDKLSWLLLGRASDGLGRNDTALLQRAALALLAGENQTPTDHLLGQLGITDFSFRQTEGETRETIVSLGRQLSQRWYVGYERSVNATTGTWQLIYRIAQRFTLRAQSGVENSLDLIWSLRW